MSGVPLDRAASVLCPHGGRAVPAGPDSRVRASGAPLVTVADRFAVVGCPLPAPPQGAPCTGVRFVTAATRVRIGGVPVLLAEGIAVCEPGGGSATVQVGASRLRAA